MRSLLMETFKRRETIPSGTKQLWRIETGMVRTLTWDDQGNIFVLGFWGHDDVVGHPLSHSEPYRIECLSPVTAYPLAPDYQCHHDMLVAYLHRTKQLLQITQIKSVKQRLVCLLDYLVQQFGQETERGGLLNFYLTHQDIADVTSSSRVTITRLMGDLHRQGTICWQRNRSLLVSSGLICSGSMSSCLSTSNGKSLQDP